MARDGFSSPPEAQTVSSTIRGRVLSKAASNGTARCANPRVLAMLAATVTSLAREVP